MLKPVLRPFDPQGATDEEFTAISEFLNRMQAEVRPLDPPLPVDYNRALLTDRPDFAITGSWVTTDGTRVTGYATAIVFLLEENKHLADVWVRVLPEYRRKGLGTSLLAQAVDFTEKHNRTLAIGFTNSRAAAGVEFASRIGAEKASEGYTYCLELPKLDRTLVQKWLQGSEELSQEFALGLWDGPYPEDRLEEIAALMDIMNDAPRGTLDVEDHRTTPEQLREEDRSLLKTGNRRWTMYACHRQTGKLAGYTEIYYSHHRPAVAQQHGTGVFPEYRNRGIGRWLKAAMLEKLFLENPQITEIRTSNADANAPMLKINQELGFEPYASIAVWQVGIESLKEYLATRGLSSAAQITRR